MKNLKIAASVAVALTMMSGMAVVSPAMAAQTMTSAQIVVNGKTLYTPDRFVQNGTTYMPIYYVIQTLTSLGVSNAWNGTKHAWAVTDTAYHGGLNLNAGSGQAGITINGAVAEQRIPTLVARDPKSGVMTTFAPIWYIQQLLNHVGLKQDIWNGSAGVWNLATTSSVVATSGNASTVNPNTDFPSAATIARYGGAVNPAPQGVTLAKWEAAVKKALAFKPTGTSGLGTDPLATSSQWYPDPHDIFYNKVFPVKDLKNGAILQHDPLVEVATIDGTNDNPNAPYVYVDEYVGYGNVPGTGVVTYWKTEQVSVHTGRVQAVMPGIGGLPVFEFKSMTPPQDQGVHFPTAKGLAQPFNPTWAMNAGPYVVPFPGWNPNHTNPYSTAYDKIVG